MPELYRSAYEFIEYHPEQSLIKHVVTPEAKSMTWKDAQKDMLELANIVRRTKPEKILVDAVHFNMPLFKQMQQWLNENLIVSFNEVDLKKWAIIVPTEFLAQVSIEQTMAANPSNTFEAQYFEDEVEAMSWLQGNHPFQHHQVR